MIPNIPVKAIQQIQAEAERQRVLAEQKEAEQKALTIKEATEALVNSGLFKLKTNYLFKADEPPGVAVLDLDRILKPDEVAPLREAFAFMPRDILRDFFNKEILGPATVAEADRVKGELQKAGIDISKVQVGTAMIDIAITYDTLLWAGVIDLFNQVNLAYVTDNKLSPEAWEKEKMDAYLLSQDPKRLEAFNNLVTRQNELSSIPEAKAIIEEYVTLPPIADLSMEISRQNAIKQLLIQKEYVVAKAIIDVYRYAMETEVGAQLVKPLPFNVTK